MHQTPHEEYNLYRDIVFIGFIIQFVRTLSACDYTHLGILYLMDINIGISFSRNSENKSYFKRKKHVCFKNKHFFQLMLQQGQCWTPNTKTHFLLLGTIEITQFYIPVSICLLPKKIVSLHSNVLDPQARMFLFIHFLFYGVEVRRRFKTGVGSGGNLYWTPVLVLLIWDIIHQGNRKLCFNILLTFPLQLSQ